MAVKKVNSKAEETKKEVAVEVEVPVEEETKEVEATVDTEVDSETGTTEESAVETTEVEIPEVEVETPVEDSVEVDTESIKASKPSGNVKIRMRVDHRCTIAMETYDLKKDKTYTVPQNVKNILNRAGLLAPL